MMPKQSETNDVIGAFGLLREQLQAAKSRIRDRMAPPTDWQTDTLPSLPAEESSLEITPAELQELVAQVHDLSGLNWDVDAFGERPMEDELVTHCVIPFEPGTTSESVSTSR